MGARSINENIIPAGQAILFNNMGNVFMQASLQGLDISLDCVIEVSMDCGPPEIRVISTEVFFGGLEFQYHGAEKQQIYPWAI